MRELGLLALSALLLGSPSPALGQEKSKESEEPFATLIVQLAKGELPEGCSASHGIIEQGLLRVEGVEDARVDPETHGIKVTYNPKKTTPPKIVAAFNKNNPDVPLRLPPRRNK
ncbi:heavy-metal-associated domain-containing protein [Acidobacteriia bacterium AH_259_A11_L15]|nr:heavy-metal-associated domain-containing protein [Acidobacteriia bacterium AH_259_A11_L15]